MNPKQPETNPNFELENLPPTGIERVQEQAMEKPEEPSKKTGKQTSPPAQAAQPVVQIPSSVWTQAPATPVTDDQTDQADAGGPAAADVDRIEQVWVDKAKAVVALNHDDPYKQNSEMSKVKADYIQKRFNKTLPTDNAVST